MDTIDTRYGPLPIEGPVERRPDGGARAAFLAAPAALATSIGRLVPQHSIDDARRMTKPPVTFHDNGQVRSLPLETRTVVKTPAGPLPAELVTFHDNGAVARVFPLNGKLSGYWTEADEAGLAEAIPLATPVGRLTAKWLAVAFDPEGRLRSLTLWPGEELSVPTPCGQLPARLGLSFHTGGTLRSIEPARPVEAPSPAGPIWAFDPDAVGIAGDDNSLAFTPDGETARLATVRTAVTVRLPDGSRRELAPKVRDSICGDGDHELTPLVLTFSPDAVAAAHGCAKPFAVIPRSGAHFTARPFVSAFAVSFVPKQCSM
ncbi:MAG: hypothetical protein B193_2131 [Solidesulfovibrio magneticus str. Maddingley MBC34]|uniref:Uncharacterized protein n=1 Tax=Solidesulfovibrio magneticus str. Maddingley MBC34 TaxID=1206767 RepID=K6GQC3_9BACT|nr:MAG: hypothetical protein B193_2131 [Solidesulfovibrio magneticus str. Maddingley MBC34]